MRTLITAYCLLATSFLLGQNFPNGFHFTLPPGDSTAQRFLPEFPKAAITDFVAIGQNGHFETGGQRLRFWGVNNSAGACFPKKDKAPWVAARMRKMGINLVRFTNMDAPWNDDDHAIFYQNSNTTAVLNYFSLDRLHFFINQLKAQGIYSCINLHAERQFKPGDGLEDADSLAYNPKAATMFDRQLIALQKDFAEQLLGSTNFYSGLRLADDPAVAMVEITNYNSFYSLWRGDRLRHFSHGGDLTQRHVDTLNLRWNGFLQERYASQTALETAWNATSSIAGQNEQALDGGFENGNTNEPWFLELHEDATADLSLSQNDPYEGDNCMQVDVTHVTGTGWHIQFEQVELSVEAGQGYTVRFAAKASQSATLTVYAMQNKDPYNWYSGTQVDLTTDWQVFDFSFISPEDNAGFVRLGFSFDNQEGSFFFDNISFADAGAQGVLPGEALSEGNIRRMDYEERANFTMARMADMAEFYLLLQRNYFNEMRDFLKNDLGVQAAISGSNGLGGPSDLYTLQDMDYVADASGWDWPEYPNGWSPEGWYVGNSPMVKTDWWASPMEIFSGLSLQGKPLIINDYRHSFPNRFSVEMMPWLASYAAFNDADGAMLYEYAYDHEDWAKDQVDDFFALHRNTSQMALMPAFAQAFRQGMVAAESAPTLLEYSPKYVFENIPASDDAGRWGTFLPFNGREALTTCIRSSFEGTGAPDFSQLPDPPGQFAETSTGETSVDFDKGFIKTISPDFVSVCGFFDENAPHGAGNLNVLQGNGFGAATWLSISGEALEKSRESLLTISSKTQNKNMVWDGVNTFHNDWGSAPTENFPLQMTLELWMDASQLRLYPLSAQGAEGSFTTLYPVGPGRFLVDIDQAADKTVWYGIEAIGEATATGEVATTDSFSVFPNPAGDWVALRLDLPRAENVSIKLLDARGQLVRVLRKEGLPIAAFSEVVTLDKIPSGIYFVECRTENGTFFEKLLVK